MNFFGIGNMELLWIMLIGVIVLGPGRLVDTARSAGKYWREARQMLRTAADAATANLDAPPKKPPSTEPLTEPEGAVARGASDESHVEQPPSTEASERP